MCSYRFDWKKHEIIRTYYGRRYIDCVSTRWTLCLANYDLYTILVFCFVFFLDQVIQLGIFPELCVFTPDIEIEVGVAIFKSVQLGQSKRVFFWRPPSWWARTRWSEKRFLLVMRGEVSSFEILFAILVIVFFFGFCRADPHEAHQCTTIHISFDLQE